MSAFQLPTLVGPSAPPLPRPTGLPRSQRRISGVAQLADMTDGKRCAFSADETRTLSREVSNNVHVGNKFVWKFTQVDDCLQKAKDGSNTHNYIKWTIPHWSIRLQNALGIASQWTQWIEHSSVDFCAFNEKWIRWNFALAFWQESYNYSYWSAALSKTEAKYSYV